MTSRLERKIKELSPSLTKTEKRVAEYALAHERDLLMETAASLAKKVGTTPMTVGRFLRALGFQGMDELRREIQQSQLESSLPILERFKTVDEGKNRLSQVGQCLKAELDGITAIYELMATPVWQQAVSLLSNSDRIYVTGFATLEGIAESFVSRLSYAHPQVQLVNNRGGMYLDVFGELDSSSCMVVIDDRRYAKVTKKVAALCKQNNIPLILITDEYCLWAQDFTELHLSAPTAMPNFWTSLAPMVSLLTHLVNAVMERGGERLSQRMERIEQLQTYFEFYEE